MAAAAPKKQKTEDPRHAEPFPVDLSKYQKLSIDPWKTATLDGATKAALLANIELCREAIVFFTACGSASGYGGHTGGAFDTVPEVMVLDAFFNGCPDKFVPIFFDEAGHRVATQYLMSVLHGHFPAEHLRRYREGHQGLPGHPEVGLTPGVKFSSGRLGHMWPFVNGVAMANPDKVCICLGSDGSQMEGDDAEAARLAVAQGLKVALFIDDNDVTIAGHPTEYLGGYDVAATLAGHGLPVNTVDGEDIDALYGAMRATILEGRCAATISKRKMMPGMQGVEGTCHGHDAVNPKAAKVYLEARGNSAAIAQLDAVTKTKDPQSEYLGSSVGRAAMRAQFGASMVALLGDMSAAQRLASVKVIDSDLAGSTGLNQIEAAYPEIFVKGPIAERGNFSAAAGFGMEKGKQGVFSTFAAFLEMCLSEITMARLNNANVLCHFSHSGVDDMADNTCHFGINNFFADNSIEPQGRCSTKLYFPCDTNLMDKVVRRAYADGEGQRFIFSTRSKTPKVLAADGSEFYGEGYAWAPGKDDVLRVGTAGYVVAYGDAIYRALDAVERLRAGGLDVGLVNKVTLNEVDEETTAAIGKSPFVLVVDVCSRKNGLGARFGTWLLKRGLAPKYDNIGPHRDGSGGLWEQAYHQGYDSKSIQDAVKKLAA